MDTQGNKAMPQRSDVPESFIIEKNKEQDDDRMIQNIYCVMVGYENHVERQVMEVVNELVDVLVAKSFSR